MGSRKLRWLAFALVVGCAGPAVPARDAAVPGDAPDAWTPAAPFTVTCAAGEPSRIYLDGNTARDEAGTWEAGPHTVVCRTLAGGPSTFDVRLYCDGVEVEREMVTGPEASFRWECE